MTLDGHTDSIKCVAELKAGRIVSGSYDNTLRVWDPAAEQPLQLTLEGHTGSIDCVAELKDGRIVSGSGDKTLRVWDPAAEQSLRLTLEGHTGGINCVAELKDGRIVSGSGDKTLRVWDLTRKNPLVDVLYLPAWVTSLLVSQSGIIVAGDGLGFLILAAASAGP